MNQPSFFEELKRRRVVRVALVYAVAAVAVGEAADVFLPALGLPAWSVTLVVALLVLGFPLAVALAWALQVTPEGIVRDKGAGVDTDAVREGGPPSSPDGVVERDDSPSIAVLPFVDMSPDRDQEYFGDGLAEELLNALTRLEGLRVAARTSTFTLAKGGREISAIGRELGVRHVLEGSVRKAGNRVRITAQLIGVHDGYHMWSETYERELEDVFAIQDEITRAVVDALRVRLVGDQRGRLVATATTSPEAYDLYLKGRHLWRLRYQHGMAAALPSFERAIELDPDFALPYTGIADTYSIFAAYGFATVAAVRRKATPALERALELAPNLPQVLFSKGLHRFCVDSDFAGSEEEFRRALEADPAFGEALMWIGLSRVCRGRLEEGIRITHDAVALDPHSTYLCEMRGFTELWAWRFEDALEASREALALESTSVIATYVGAMALTALGRHTEALDLWARVLELTQRNPTFRSLRIHSLVRAGEQERALEELEGLEALKRRDGLPAVVLHWAYAALGRVEEAIGCLETAEREEGGSTTLPGWPLLNPIRRDPRYREWMKRVGVRDEAWLAMMTD